MPKMTRGVWTRKPEMEFVDLLTVNRVYDLISRHPASILSNEEFSKEYAQYFGEPELTILKSRKDGKFDMVMSPNPAWVQGDKVELKASAPEPVPPPGFKFAEGPMGTKTIVPITEQGFNETQCGQIYDHVLEALKVWSKG